MKPTQIIEVAAEEVGYIGKKSNKNLYDDTANITGKYTKYAQELFEAGYYNGNKNGWNWCAVFVDWVIWVACGRDRAKAEAFKPTSVLGASCTAAYDLYNTQGRITSEPSVGAQIFYKDSKDPTKMGHTGLVSAVRDTEIETIEGNWSNMVTHKLVSRGDPSIAGYGLPYYEDEITPFIKGDRVVLLSEYAYNGVKLASWVTDGRPLWVVSSNADRTSVTVDETLQAVTAVMKTCDVMLYEPAPEPVPPTENSRLRKISELFAELSKQFEEWANE